MHMERNVASTWNETLPPGGFFLLLSSCPLKNLYSSWPKFPRTPVNYANRSADIALAAAIYLRVSTDRRRWRTSVRPCRARQRGEGARGSTGPRRHAEVPYQRRLPCDHAIHRHDRADWSSDVSDLRGFCRVRTFHDPAADQRRSQPGQGAGQAAWAAQSAKRSGAQSGATSPREWASLEVAKTLGFGTGTVQRIKLPSVIGPSIGFRLSDR